MMTFADLHELLRLELVRRINSGALTGTRLAEQTGFRQAHISNFLNRKRALSLEGLDRVLKAQRLSIDQILPLALDAHGADLAEVAQHPRSFSSQPQPGIHTSSGAQLQFQGSRPATSRQSQIVSELNFRGIGAQLPSQTQSQNLPSPTSDEVVYSVPLVSSSVAMDHPRIAPAAVLESLPISASRLFDRNNRTHSPRHLWQRFVAIRVDAQQSAAMAPLLATGAAAVLDRHATSPVSLSRPAEPSLFAVRSGSALLIRLVELDDDRLILRPTNASTPVQLVPLSADQEPADHLIGRVTLLLTAL